MTLEANIIGFNVVYKIIVCDHQSLKIKACFAPHGNEDSLINELRSVCFLCSLSGVSMLLSAASLQKWRLLEVDVRAAYFQKGTEERDVYVMPHRKSTDHGKMLWLLFTAVYGLISSSAKWQYQSEDLLQNLDLSLYV